MSQKILLGFVAVLTIIAATACGLVWSLASDFQTAAKESQAAAAELLKQGRDANQELLDQNQKMMQQLTALANRPAEATRTPDWNPLKVRVVKNDKEKTPGKGFQVTLQGPHFSDVEPSVAGTRVTITTDENGVADFGLVRPGRFDGYVNAPWGEQRSLEVIVKPGNPSEKVIIAPVGPLEPIQIKPIVKWPKQLEGLDVALLVRVFRKDVTQVDGAKWPDRFSTQLLIRPDGRYAVYGDYGYSNYGFSNTPGEQHIYEQTEFLSTPEVFQDSFPWRGREPGLQSMILVELPKDAEFPKEGQKLKQLAPATFLHRYSNQYPIVSIGQQEIDQAFSAETEENGRQIWTFDVPLPYVFVTRIMSAPEQFPKLPAETVVLGAMSFLLSDKNGDNELTKEEIDEGPSRTAKSQLFEAFPVSFQKFVETYVASRSRGRS